MPEVEHLDTPGFSFEPVAPKEQEAPSFLLETVPAAFRMENDVMNLWQYMKNQRQYTPTPGFNPGQRLREIDNAERSALWETHGPNFIGVRSEDEFQAKLAKIRKEEADRQILDRSGAGGVMAAMAAGLVSPTIALPFVGQARGLRAAAVAGGYGLAGAAAQEFPLMLNQETRTKGEVAFSLAASTALSLVLGGAVGVLSKSERQVLEQNLERELGMVFSPGETAIPSSTVADSVTGLGPVKNQPFNAGQMAPGGADIVAQTQSAGGVAAGVPDLIIQTSPVLRQIDNKVLTTASNIMAQLADGGVRLEGNARGIASAAGGSIESLVKTYDALYVKGLFAVDDAYAEYFYQGVEKPTIAPNLRAQVGGFMSNNHMSKADFRREVSMAMWSKDKHSNPFVQKAAESARRDFFNPLLEAAQNAGLIGKEIDLKGDLSYLMRDYNTSAIRANSNKFIEIIARNYEKMMMDNFQEKAAKLAERETKTATLLEDLQRPADEVERLQSQFKGDLQRLEKSRLGVIARAEDEINSLRQQARVARRNGDDLMADKLLEEARQLEKDAGPMLQETRADRSAIKERLRNLNKARVVFEKKQAAKLELIERLEDLNMTALETAVRRGRAMLDKLDTVTEAEFGKEVRKLMSTFSQVGEQFDKTIDRIAKEMDGEMGGDLGKLLGLETRQTKLGEQLTKLGERLDDAEDMVNAVPAFRSILEAQMDAMLQKVNKINSDRAVRSVRLREQANNLDPSIVTKRIEDLRMADKQRRQDFLEAMRGKGAEDVDLKKGTADFKEFSRAIAVEIKDKIIGTYLRNPAVDMMRSERGAELARAINIDSREIFEFLETDIDKLMRKSVQTIGPDIELMKRFGSLDIEDLARRMADEMNAKLEQLANKVKDAEAQLATGYKSPSRTPNYLNGKVVQEPLSAAEREKLQKFINPVHQKKLQDALSNNYFSAKRDVEAVWDRLRGEWGIPDDPEAIGYRLGKVALGLNVLRFMGGTVISSLADVGRPVMKHGLTRVFGDGFNLLINDLKSFKLSAREVRLAGAALDPITHSRSKALADIMTDYATTTKFERGVETLSNKMGVVAMFDYWTSAMKQFSGVVANARFLDSIDVLMTGSGTKAEIADATTFLASHNIGRLEAEKIWKEMQDGGARKVRGTWLPDTELWKDKDIQQLFRAAVVKNVNDTIIEPGVELPLVMNKTIANRLLFQFKSFGMSSTYKTLAAGMQERDMAVLNGVMVSLAFGALSYYTYAMTVGGKAQETMLNADAAKWADEAIQRSGVLAAFSDVQRIMERLPYVGQYATLSGAFGDGERLQRGAGNGMLDTLLGPTYGFAKNLVEGIAGLEDPTQSTAQKFRTLVAYQNLVGFRRLLDLLIDNSGLPERRDQ